MKRLLTMILCLTALLLFGCARGKQTADAGMRPESGQSQGHKEGTPVEGEELLCLADSEEEAKAIADQYGIRLVGFSGGVATFQTERDPAEVVEEGLKNGWTELSLNRRASLSDG